MISTGTGRSGKGAVDSCGASGAEQFYLHLQRTGDAHVSLRRWDAGNTTTGNWSLEGDTAVITWPNGRRDVLRESKDGRYSLLTYRNGQEAGKKKPDEVMPATRSSANEASQYFNAGDVRLFTMSDIRGVWVPADSGLSPERYIRVEGWGRATRHPASGEASAQGEWKLFNDRVVITWGDGSKDMLRAGLQGWVQESFPPGVPASGTPSESISIRRVDESKLNLGSR